MKARAMNRIQHSAHVPRRRGVTLLELLVVVSLMGILSTVVVGRYGRAIIGDLSSQGDAHRLWLDIQYARRLAIKNGQSCCLVFGGGVTPTGYRLLLGSAIEVAAGKAALVEQARTFGADMTVTPTASILEFDFEGHAAGNYSVLLTAPDQRWQVSVVPLSGLASVTKL